MFSLTVWCVYGLLVGMIAKALVSGDENFGFIKTVALGVAGSYIGGALLYLVGNTTIVEPAGLFMGTVGAVAGLVTYKKMSEK
jgi:uncharacterized membrane protein YeaQ/YmgE (transglycosylase-associated protein family)